MLIFVLVEGWNSLEQYIGFEVRLAFNYCCSLQMKTTAVVECTVPENSNLLPDLFNSMRNLHLTFVLFFI